MNNSLDLMRARFKVRGGTSQQDRMIKDKRESLDKAVLYSYQGAKVKKIGAEKANLALINPNAVKQDYDDKVISVGYEFEYKPGTVFEWLNTGTYWLIYLQDLTELAYFRGDIRKCNYEIKWKDSEGLVKSTMAAVKGPSEKTIDSQQTNGMSIDSPNYSLNILIPNNEDTVKYFQRYSEFYLNSVCWRIEAIDSISMPGIIEINAIEYYANKDADNLVEGIVDGFLLEEIPEPASGEIEGESFIKPKISYTYTYVGEEVDSWHYDSKLPLSVSIDGKSITIQWTKTYTGQFVLSYGSEEKTIVVESLF